MRDDSKATLRRRIDDLTDARRECIIRMREDGFTFERIASYVGLTRERVRQIHAKAALDTYSIEHMVNDYV